ncbi:uncharacterized protein [Miscanthus floridulus]|uniref:uncharacterized protein isoform X2 n=1 Tax=Miscanthus floridulus TaxID=154761 RepID=UPI00345B380A
MAAGTSYVRTPDNAGKGPAEHDVEEDEDEDDEDEDEEDYDEIGMSQLGDAPFPTQFDEQEPSYTQQYCRVYRQQDRIDVGFTPNVLPSRPKRQRRPRYPYTPGS